MEASTQSRDAVIIRTGIIGILTNILLSASKAFAGMATGSVAVTMDAVNNLSDALSSVVTIVGIKLAGRSPDRKHPLGHGRIEYLSALIVAAIILYAGISALVASVDKILHPQNAEYTTVSLVIMAVAIVVKLLLGAYVKQQGKKANSTALMASGSDATFDAVLSASVLASAILYMTTGIALEAFVGVLIAVVIIKAGIGMISETLDDILGHRADEEVSKAVKRVLTEDQQVRGAYDLLIHNYGPDKNYASVHVELPDTMTVEEVDRLTRRAEQRVMQETGVILTGIGVYAYNTRDDEAARIRNAIQEKVFSHDWALQMHGFYVDLQEKTIRFDVVVSFDMKREEALAILQSETEQLYPDYTICIVPDADLSD